MNMQITKIKVERKNFHQKNEIFLLFTFVHIKVFRVFLVQKKYFHFQNTIFIIKIKRFSFKLCAIFTNLHTNISA